MKPASIPQLLLTFFTLCATAYFASAQNLPVIGSPSPEFLLSPVRSYFADTVSSSMLKGKPYILVLISSGCAASFTSLSEINELNRKFKRESAFLLVGRSDSKTQLLFEKFKEKLDLELPIAYNDDLFVQFKAKVLPRLYWIDKEGVIKAITSTDALLEENVRRFIKGESFRFVNRQDIKRTRYPFNSREHFLVNKNGGEPDDFLFRSVLSKWDMSKPTYSQPFVSARADGRMQFLGVSIADLYRLAYGDTIFSNPQYDQPTSYGRLWQYPLLEVSDTTVFKPDLLNEANIYCYSVAVPEKYRNAAKIQEIMRRDLDNYFGYQVSVETRVMPYWRLVAQTAGWERLRTKGGRKHYPFSDYADFYLQNVPISVLTAHLYLYHHLEPPFIDETDFTSNIDLKIEAFSTDDLETIRKELNKNGLDLIKSEKPMKVIVLKDPAD